MKENDFRWAWKWKLVAKSGHMIILRGDDVCDDDEFD